MDRTETVMFAWQMDCHSYVACHTSPWNFCKILPGWQKPVCTSWPSREIDTARSSAKTWAPRMKVQAEQPQDSCLFCFCRVLFYHGLSIFIPLLSFVHTPLHLQNRILQHKQLVSKCYTLTAPHPRHCLARNFWGHAQNQPEELSVTSRYYCDNSVTSGWCKKMPLTLT